MGKGSALVLDDQSRPDGDLAVAFHPLVYLADGDEVTIGRPDIDSYAIFPPDGAELVRRLADGTSVTEAARWYEARYGETADMDHVLAALRELRFTRGASEPSARVAPVRWRWLGKLVFSPLAWIVYGAIACWAVVTVARTPELMPTYHDLFFSKYFSIIELVLVAGTIPLLLLHESWHALAARRLGLRSRLTISQRFYYLVMETALDGLVAVPRRKRYLPILAGMLADAEVVAILIIVADLTRGPAGTISPAGRLCLGFAFAAFLRLLWQFFFYIRTDLYVLITTVLGCVDLHTTAMRMLRNRANRLLARPARLADESAWHPVDRRVAQWYSWLIVAGYSVSLGTLVFAVGPFTIRMFAGAIGRFGGGSTVTGPQLLDSAVFVAINLAQIVFTIYIAVRERTRRRRSQLQHVIA